MAGNFQIYATPNTQTCANHSKIAGFAQQFNGSIYLLTAELRAGIGKG
jgi:hypothetical protein